MVEKASERALKTQLNEQLIVQTQNPGDSGRLKLSIFTAGTCLIFRVVDKASIERCSTMDSRDPAPA
jgi:hypothetical protein